MSKFIIVKMIIFYSHIYGISPEIALAVAQTESGLNPSIISKTHDVGLFQLNEHSFKQYSREQLLDPNINIPEGIKYLAKMQKECKYKDNNEWLICYNYGIKNAKKVKYPGRWPYTRKVLIAMEGN